MITYKNNFYDKNRHSSNGYIKPTFTTNVKPVQYEGFDIYKHSNIEFHIVKDSACVGMVGSVDAAKHRIDRNNDLKFIAESI